MRYSPPVGYALMGITLACIILGAPWWLFLATGVSTLVMGVVGLRQVRAERRWAEEQGEDGPSGESRSVDGR